MSDIYTGYGYSRLYRGYSLIKNRWLYGQHIYYHNDVFEGSKHCIIENPYIPDINEALTENIVHVKSVGMDIGADDDFMNPIFEHDIVCIRKDDNPKKLYFGLIEPLNLNLNKYIIWDARGGGNTLELWEHKRDTSIQVISNSFIHPHLIDNLRMIGDITNEDSPAFLKYLKKVGIEITDPIFKRKS